MRRHNGRLFGGAKKKKGQGALNCDHYVDSEIGVANVTFCGRAASTLKPSQRVQSLSLEERLLDLATETSYRKASDIANGFLHRTSDTLIKTNTQKDHVVSVGMEISKEYELMALDALAPYGIDDDKGTFSNIQALPEHFVHPEAPMAVNISKLKDVIDKYNGDREERERIRPGMKVAGIEASAGNCCYVSIDDVGVKHQKDERKSGKEKEGKYVENTVIHIQQGERTYRLAAIGMRKAFVLLMGFLVHNGLMNDRLVFLTDGAKDIRSYIDEFFGFRQNTIILDWLHLKKKIKEFLSMGVMARNKEKKKEIIKDTLRMLWVGNVADAQEYLRNLKTTNVKNRGKIDEAVDYLERKKDYIACYAVRQMNNLRVSSNCVEKSNDIIVAQRQKHNGMSWSRKGSGALAAIKTAKINGELNSWLRNRVITFKFAA